MREPTKEAPKPFKSNDVVLLRTKTRVGLKMTQT